MSSQLIYGYLTLAALLLFVGIGIMGSGLHLIAAICFGTGLAFLCMFLKHTFLKR